MIAVADTLAPDTRFATVDTPEELGWMVDAWLHADGVPWPSENVAALVSAIRRGDWPRAHDIADRLSLDLDAV